MPINGSENKSRKTSSKREGRPHQPELKLLNEQLHKCIEGAQQRLDEAFRKVVESSGMTKRAFSEIFALYVKDASILSKIGVPSGKDVRHATWIMAVIMHVVFGVDLNAIARGENPPDPVIPAYVTAALTKWAEEKK